MRRLTLALALLPALSGVNWSASAQTNATMTDPESYAVYGSALVNLGREHSRIALLAQTHPDDGCKDRIPAGWEDVAADFTRANADPRTLLEWFDLGLPVEFVPASELLAADKAAHDYVERQLADVVPPIPWPFTRFVGGKVYMVSAIGFSADRTRAMFMLEHDGGSQAVGGEQILRVNVAGQWLDPPQVPLRCMWVL